MRVFYFLVLVVLAGAVAVFALQNQAEVTLHYFDREAAAPLWAVVAAVYCLGMLSGWTVVGILRRSLHAVTEDPRG